MKKIVDVLKKWNAFEPDRNNRLLTVETYFFLFLVGAVVGWFYELFFYWIMEDRISNNGFFFGPYLPIYGFGALFIVLITKKVKKYPYLVFFLTIPITGILEYITGYAMYAIWHTRWWDYRGKFMNIGGYVCLRSVFTFAIGAILLIYIIEPAILVISSKLKEKTRNAICLVILGIFLVDIVATILFRMPPIML